jgi:hypothetical protein
MKMKIVLLLIVLPLFQLQIVFAQEVKHDVKTESHSTAPNTVNYGGINYGSAVFGKLVHVNSNIKSAPVYQSIYLTCVDDSSKSSDYTSGCSSYVFVYSNGFSKVPLSAKSTDSSTALNQSYFAKEFPDEIFAISTSLGQKGKSVLNQVSALFTSDLSPQLEIKNAVTYLAIQEILIAVINKKVTQTPLNSDSYSNAIDHLNSLGWSGEDILTYPNEVSLGGQITQSQSAPVFAEISLRNKFKNDNYFIQFKLNSDIKSAQGSIATTFGAPDRLRFGALTKIESGYYRNRWAVGFAISSHVHPRVQWVAFVLPIAWGNVYGINTITDLPQPFVQQSNELSQQRFQPSVGFNGAFQMARKTVLFIDLDAGIIHKSREDEMIDNGYGRNYTQYGYTSSVKGVDDNPIGQRWASDQKTHGGFVNSEAGVQLVLKNGFSLKVSGILNYSKANSQVKFEYAADRGSVNQKPASPNQTYVVTRTAPFEQQNFENNVELNRLMSGFRIRLVKSF